MFNHLKKASMNSMEPHKTKMDSYEIIYKKGCVQLEQVKYDSAGEATLTVVGHNNYIRSSIPIDVGELRKLIIRGIGENCTLYLMSDSNYNPAIGRPIQFTGKDSQYVSKPCYLEELVIDNVTVIPITAVDNFSIGSYGRIEYPNITLINKGAYYGPEVSGIRYISKHNECCDKGIYNDTCEYIIDNGTLDHLGYFTTEELQTISKIETVYTDFSAYVNLSCNRTAIEVINYIIENNLTRSYEYVLDLLYNLNQDIELWQAEIGVFFGVDVNKIISSYSTFKDIVYSTIEKLCVSPDCRCELGDAYNVNGWICAIILREGFDTPYGKELALQILPTEELYDYTCGEEAIQEYIDKYKDLSLQYEKYLTYGDSIKDRFVR